MLYFFQLSNTANVSARLPHPASCRQQVFIVPHGTGDAALPDRCVSVAQDLGQQLGRLLEAAGQLIQLLLHGEDSLLQLSIGVVPVGAEVAHDHLHLNKNNFIFLHCICNYQAWLFRSFKIGFCGNNLNKNISPVADGYFWWDISAENNPGCIESATANCFCCCLHF